MSLFRAPRRRHCAALLGLVVAIAVLNPFCCRFLPYYAADVLQTEETAEAEDELCPGKPKAVRDELAVLPSVSTGVCAALDPLGGTQVEIRIARIPPPPSGVAPPRYKVLGMIRV
jgi:hypothetical protein